MGFKACIAGQICLGGGTIAYAAPTAYIPLGSGNAVIAVDAANGKIIKRYHLDKIPGTGKVYVSSSKAPKIWVVDQNTLTVTGTIQLPAGEGHQIAVIK